MDLKHRKSINNKLPHFQYGEDSNVYTTKLPT